LRYLTGTFLMMGPDISPW